MRIALANVRTSRDRNDNLQTALDAIHQAAAERAELICFPECYIPGYRTAIPEMPLEAVWLGDAWTRIDEAAASLGITIILGTERVDEEKLFISARVTDSSGQCTGFQDKVQLDPSEEEIYTPGTVRSIFECSGTPFGIVICHEGWRYPETVRWAARRGAKIVFHPHFELVSDPDYSPEGFADPDNTFHEKAALCRAAENSCYFATVNCALQGAVTTSAVIDPGGRLIQYQPHGEEGLLVVDIDPGNASGFLAGRLKPEGVYTGNDGAADVSAV